MCITELNEQNSNEEVTMDLLKEKCSGRNIFNVVTSPKIVFFLLKNECLELTLF